MSIEILSSGASFPSYVLQHLLRQQRAAEVARKQIQIQSGFQRQINSEYSTRAKWNLLQPDIQVAVANLENILSRIDTIRSGVWNLLSLETNARTGDADSIAGFAAKFDAIIRSLNSTANQNVTPPNLIGSVFANDLSYSYIQNDLRDLVSTSHVDLSTGYYIVDSGGNTWRKKNSATDGTLVQYNSLGVETGKSVEVTRQLRLDDLNGSAIDFTILPGTASEESFTGATLFTNGLNVLDSWAYDGLATTSGRSRAESSLKSAMVMIDIQRAAFAGALVRAKFDLELAQDISNGATNRISSLNQMNLVALQEIADTATGENLAASAAATSNLILLQAYRNMFNTGMIGNFFDILA